MSSLLQGQPGLSSLRAPVAATNGLGTTSIVATATPGTTLGSVVCPGLPGVSAVIVTVSGGVTFVQTAAAANAYTMQIFASQGGNTVYVNINASPNGRCGATGTVGDIQTVVCIGLINNGAALNVGNLNTANPFTIGVAAFAGTTATMNGIINGPLIVDAIFPGQV